MGDAETELDPALEARIEDIASHLDTLDHYALLGIPRDADRKAIKSAYFAQAGWLHPDRHYGKRLGPWKHKMELIFGRLTIAHETLTHATDRAEYDAYLTERERIAALERALDVDESTLAAAEERPVGAHAVRTSLQVAPRVATPEDERARREALARKLSGGSHRRMAAVRPTPATPVAQKPSTPGMQAVRPTSLGMQPATPPLGVEAVVSAARNALALGDLASASMKMRLAAEIDARFTAEANAIAKRLHASMAEGYAKQAEYEASQQQWLEAALSWSKAFEGRPDDGAYAERAAHALHRAGADLHKAANLGESAVRLRPEDPRAHATLASIYLEAGLIRRAKSEIDAAVRLAPHDAQVRELARQIATRT